MSEPSTSEQIEEECKESTRADPRKGKIPTDFTINVENQSFNVHRDVIIAKSEYFKAMLAYDTKENQHGFVYMKDVNPNVVRECIEFMYTGNVDEISVDIENVGEVLQASEIIQLESVRELCLKVMMEHLKPENCLTICSLASKFGSANLEEKAHQIIKDTFEVEDVTAFIKISKDDFVEWITNSHRSNELIWEAIGHWLNHDIENRNNDILELIELMNWDQANSGTLLKSIWKNLIFRSSKASKKFVFRKLFYDIESFKTMLNTGNYYMLKNIAAEYSHTPKQVEDFISSFGKLYFDRLAVKRDFNTLSIEEMLSYFRDPNIGCLPSDVFKWRIMIKWIKYNPGRESYFPTLVKYIKFDQIPNQIIKNEILIDPLTKQFKKCKRQIVDVVFTKDDTVDNSNSIACYQGGDINITICPLSSQEKSHCVPLPTSRDVNAEIFSLSNKLCFISNKRLFYMNKAGKWLERQTMKNTCAGKIAVSGDSVFVIGKDRMSCYNALKDDWEEDLPGCGFEVGCATASCGFLYAFREIDVFAYAYKNKKACGDKSPKIFHIDSKKWIDAKTEQNASSATMLNDNVYTITQMGNVKKFQSSTGNWENSGKLSHISILVPCNGSLLAIIRHDYRVISYDENFREWVDTKRALNSGLSQATCFHH
uniref:uncharacterized protein LOC120345614 n=1 Tax=Styela clava TaxID=7725 RepID=UPI00193A73A0|nr:uncharacterized protein LOC120345614 [Styela clava]